MVTLLQNLHFVLIRPKTWLPVVVTRFSLYINSKIFKRSSYLKVLLGFYYKFEAMYLSILIDSTNLNTPKHLSSYTSDVIQTSTLGGIYNCASYLLYLLIFLNETFSKWYWLNFWHDYWINCYESMILAISDMFSQ